MEEIQNSNNSLVIKDITAENFVSEVIEASNQKPVLVDFWAPWCSPCKQLTPILESAVSEFKNKVVMVKVNIDENQSIASQLQIQSIPTVYVFFQGEVVDGFQGNLPESKVKEFLKKVSHLSGPGEEVEELLEGLKLEIQNGNWKKINDISKNILKLDVSNVEANAFMIKSLIALKNFEEAKKHVLSLTDDLKKELLIKESIDSIETAETSYLASSDIESLKEKFKKDPDNLQINFDLSIALFGNGEIKEAFDLLLSSIKKDLNWNDQAARKQLLEFIKTDGLNTEEAKTARRKLSSLIFS